MHRRGRVLSSPEVAVKTPVLQCVTPCSLLWWYTQRDDIRFVARNERFANNAGQERTKEMRRCSK
jgi:hypothetical protein